MPSGRPKGYDVLAHLKGSRPGTHIYKLRSRLHDDVPLYMREDEPCFMLKELSLSGLALSERAENRAEDEAQALIDLEHTNLVRYQKAFLHEERLCYMTEYADAGTLHDLIRAARRSGERLSSQLVKHLMIQACHGLKRLHESSVVHRAVKSRNVLLFAEGLYSHPECRYRVKLTDIRIPELQRRVRLSSLRGSDLRYLAPEVFAGRPQDEKVDIWALGCVLYEMLTLSPAFSSTSAIQQASFTPLLAEIEPELRTLVATLLQIDPGRRPTAAELLQLPALHQWARELPNPVLLDGTFGTPAAGAVPETAGGPPKSGSRQPGHAKFDAGTACWAKHGSDGQWHRAIVQSAIDCNAYFVQVRPALGRARLASYQPFPSRKPRWGGWGAAV